MLFFLHGETVHIEKTSILSNETGFPDRKNIPSPASAERNHGAQPLLEATTFTHTSVDLRRTVPPRPFPETTWFLITSRFLISS